MWRQKIVEVAKNKDNSDIQFAVATEDSFKDDLKTLELDDSGEEINIGLWDADGKRYRMEPDEDFASDVVQEFIDQWRNSKYKILKSTILCVDFYTLFLFYMRDFFFQFVCS